MVAKLAEKVAPAYNYFIVKIEGLIFGDKRFKQIWNENHHFQIRIKPFSMNLRDILWGFFCCLLILEKVFTVCKKTNQVLRNSNISQWLMVY